MPDARLERTRRAYDSPALVTRPVVIDYGPWRRPSDTAAEKLHRAAGHVWQAGHWHTVQAESQR